MKRFLGICAILVVLAVSVLAVTDTETVPVYLNVPAFVRITINDSDGQFDLVFDPANPESTVEDTVALLAEANVNYDVDFSLLPVQSYSNLNHPSWRLEKNKRNGKIKQGVRI